MQGAGRGGLTAPCAGWSRTSGRARRTCSGRRWDYLAWNKSFERVFSWEPGPDPLSRNHVWLWFMDPARRRTLCSGDWATSARLLVAKFRADSAQQHRRPRVRGADLRARVASPEFRKLWKRHEVAGSGDGRKELNHPVVGPLAFDHAVFRHGETGDQRLILYTPSCEHDTRAKLARLLDDEEADLELALSPALA